VGGSNVSVVYLIRSFSLESINYASGPTSSVKRKRLSE
jgi:hypothetical protein